MRQATAPEILLLLRDRLDELRALISEPDAVLSMPIDGGARILATITHPLVQDEVILFMTLDDKTVRVPVQLTDGHQPVKCGPWLQKQQELTALAEAIRTNDLAVCLAVEIRHRQALETLVIDQSERLSKAATQIEQLEARIVALEACFGC